ncbi:hypothetical protein [Candidatus Tisiphia endosymbiont of Beris chalybata]|uniref:hypothetical protein n=1 Tax=Candidatus Tisiphia endosymbiont of Beris chalybata TaxID=3066262 RepID=UPI00312C8B8F
MTSFAPPLQELLEETAKITQSIAKSGRQKISNPKQQREIIHKMQTGPTKTVSTSNLLMPPNTPSNVRLSSTRQR